MHDDASDQSPQAPGATRPGPADVRGSRPFVAAMVALAVVFWFAMGSALILAHQVLDGMPDRQTIGRVSDMSRSSVFYDIKGRPAFTIFKEQRLEVPLDRMSPHLRQAMLAIEDQRFYDHRGIDLVRVGGAALVNLRERRAAQGGSTITQQLARMSFLTTEKTLSRKAQEVVLAALIETEYSKEQIFELYLNKVYFGAGLYGAEAASLGYFGKHASELTLAEAALLAGLVKAPSNYAPTLNVERAVQRRNVVLQAMLEAGMIDAAAHADARASRVALSDALRKEEPYGRYFKEHVRRELVARFGEALVYEGGLRVYTTIDLDLQRAADAEVQRALADLTKRGAGRRAAVPAEDLQAALVALDPHTGEVRALVGGRDFLNSHFNRALQAKRQPGSAFKPFVYAAALEAGYTPATIISGLNQPIQTVQGAWVPEEAHSTASSMSMRAALRVSSNRAAVRMLEELGVSKAVSYANRLGISDMPSVPSLALGAGEVTLERLTAAFAVFANGGVRRTPSYIRRVEDQDGDVLFQAQLDAEQVISAQTAFLMSHMLAEVIDRGTAARARQLGFRLPAAGKTGTTNEYRDGWFVGYTPKLVTGVWVGFDQPQTIMNGGYAAQVAVPLWAGFMRKATTGHAADWYKAPAGIVTAPVCRLSGRKPTEACSGGLTVDEYGNYTSVSSVYTEHFVKGTEPQDTCHIHTTRSVFGRLAGLVGGTSTPPAEPRATGAARTEEPPAVATVARQTAAEDEPQMQQEEPEKKKKRGFWKRLLGIGKDDDRNEQRREQRDED